MNSIKRLVTIAVAVGIFANAKALAESQALLTMPDFPQNPVLDRADALSPSQETALNARVRDFELKTSMQIKLVVEKDVSPYKTASAYAEDLYRYWKLGDKDKHNGLLLLIAKRIGSPREDMKDYCRIMTGWGIVTIIPDTVVIDDIKHKHMMPRLPSQPYLAFDNSLDRIFQDIGKWKTQYPEDNTVKGVGWSADDADHDASESFAVSGGSLVSADALSDAAMDEVNSAQDSPTKSWFYQNIGSILLFGIPGVLLVLIIVVVSMGGGSSSSTSYYRSSSDSKKDSSSSGCGSSGSGCGSDGGGSSCGGGGGCGGGGCGS